MSDDDLHGWPKPSKIMAQINYPQPYGLGGKTIAAWGCPAVALAEGQRMSGIRAGATPVTVCERALTYVPAVWAPGQSAAVLAHMAASAGFTVSPAFTVGKGGLSSKQASLKICDAIDGMGLSPRRGFGWLHVDKDNDGQGDHWVLAIAYDDDWIYCTDSAPGRITPIDRKTLRGLAVWGDVEKTYQVTRGYLLGV
jgi:hypothetical protein